MIIRATLIGGVASLVAVATGTSAWRAGPHALGAPGITLAATSPETTPEPAAPAESSSPGEAPLPIPPVPPRIAEGEDYEKCLDMLATDPTGANTFADAWEATGGGDGALHCHALARVELGDPATGAAMLDRLAQSSHAAAAARSIVFSQAGQAWMMAGEPDRAYASATLALTLSPADPDLLINRSIAAAGLERYEAAVDDLNHALELDPKRIDAVIFRATALRHLGKLDQAEEDIDHACTLDPENPDALLERGIIRQRRGDLDGAREDWEKAAELAPDSATGDLAQQNLALLDAGPSRQ
ncbi:MAG TPA: tetratricopeptide repeat protein [Acetobacteraceae bacterium]|nr:tetratricopeptide repeat protein [Acetobacteraceae bacterium]